ncbi:VOC family protein [Mariniflexile litorale]|uniref:VOC family protein n=1 Tax=Mariniflexile litorale TaxID=3045158 RepID=A0AAU7ECF5_9FLAO|nr:VOC family protein [Mariniflexile sp. KMM 9835]MDQ8213034.1 VOC family protein [Mariniflexile sp. KMM 9835]
METNNIITKIDHLGLNVPDINTATIFLQEAFDAEIINESYSRALPPLEASDELASTLNLAPKATLHSCRMIKIGSGVRIELFEIYVDGQRQPIKSSDLGLIHFALYTDSMHKAIQKFEAAGGKMLSGPNPFLFPSEKGDKNFFCYGLTPWGTTIEFITYPDGMPYEKNNNLY